MKNTPLILPERSTRSEGAAPTVRTPKSRKIFLAGIAGLTALIFGLAPQVFLLFFCCVLFAVFLVAFCRLIEWARPIQRKWSLTMAVGLLLMVAGLGFWLMGPQLRDQFIRFTTELPRAISHAKAEIATWPFGSHILQSLENIRLQSGGFAGAFSRASSVLSSAAGILVQIVVVIFVGLYLASDSALYMNAFAKLFPGSKRQRVTEILAKTGDTLRWWLTGRLLLMASNGVVTVLGLWLLGIPLAVTLGIISALLNFVPNFGPFIAAVPAVLIGLLESPEKGMHVAIFYLIYQMFDGYVLTPLVQHRTVSLPPALILMTQVLFGVLFGSLGVLVAVPLAAVGLVFFQEVYQKEILGEQN